MDLQQEARGLKEVEDKAVPDIEEGVRARTLLEHPMLVEAFEVLREKAMNGFRKAAGLVGENGDQARRHMGLYMKVIDEVHDDLRKHLTGGKVAQFHLEAARRRWNVWQKVVGSEHR